MPEGKVASMTPVTLTIHAIWDMTDPVFVSLQKSYFDNEPFYIEGTPFKVEHFEILKGPAEFVEVKATLMKDADSECLNRIETAVSYVWNHKINEGLKGMKKNKRNAQDVWNNKCDAVMRKASRIYSGKGQFLDDDEIAILAGLAVAFNNASLRLRHALDPILKIDMKNLLCATGKEMSNAIAKCQERYYQMGRKYDGKHRCA